MVPSPPENDKFSIIQNYELFYIQQNISTTFCYINHCAHSCPWLRCGRSGGTPIYIYVQTSGGGNCAEYHLLCASCAKNLLLPSSHSHPFNPTIADVLYLSTCLESWGSGAKRIMDECKGQNIKEPDWYQEGHNVVIKFARESMMSGEQPISNRHDTDIKSTTENSIICVADW
ncbi:ATP-binding protein [Prevotella sp. P5-108]|uniref:ATP-binding protein n=1 Tax=Prevotella sp. P5-108 TaxID=2024225 RepID=UPI00117D6B2A